MWIFHPPTTATKQLSKIFEVFFAKRNEFSSLSQEGGRRRPNVSQIRSACLLKSKLNAACKRSRKMETGFREIPLPLGEGAAKRRVRGGDRPSSGRLSSLRPSGLG